jgi:hypothetical protein
MTDANFRENSTTDIELTFSKCLSKAFTYMVNDGWRTLIERADRYLDVVADNVFYSNGDNVSRIKMFIAAAQRATTRADRTLAIKMLTNGDLIHLVPMIFPNRATLLKVFTDEQIPILLAMWRVATTSPQTIAKLLQLPEVYKLAHNLVNICSADGTSQLLLSAEDSLALSFKINRNAYKRRNLYD